MRLFAANADTPVTAANLDRLFSQRPELFAAYTHVTIDTINVVRRTTGTTATVAGTISYRGGAPTRNYSATLRKEHGTWKLLQIQFPEGVGQ